MNLTNKELRRFGLSLGLGLMVVSAVLNLKGKRYLYLPHLSILIVLIALLRPALLRVIKNTLEGLGRIITGIITGILLLFLFYLVIAPVGLAAKLFKREFLKLGFEDTASYFEKRDRGGVDKAAYERQF